MERVRYRERKSNLMETEKPKSRSWKAHVMSLYDIVKLAPNIQPSFYLYTKYLKCLFQKLMIVATTDSIHQMFTVHKTMGLEFHEHFLKHHIIP